MDINTLRSIGITIWWSEGTKSRKDKRWKVARSYPIEVTNTNPQIIRVFLLFLRNIVNAPEEKICVQVQIHEGDVQSDLENYWSKVTEVPSERFNKTIVRPVGNKIGKSLGTCKVRFSDKLTYLLLEEMLLSELMKIEVGNHGILSTSNRVSDLLE